MRNDLPIIGLVKGGVAEAIYAEPPRHEPGGRGEGDPEIHGDQGGLPSKHSAVCAELD